MQGTSQSIQKIKNVNIRSKPILFSHKGEYKSSIKDNFGIPVFTYKGWFAYDFEQFLLANKLLLINQNI